jgi:hypothetical protein
MPKLFLQKVKYGKLFLMQSRGFYRLGCNPPFKCKILQLLMDACTK